MAYIVQPVVSVCYVDDSLLSIYQAAGWTQATAAQVAAWFAGDPYAGTQGAPLAPPLLSPSAAPGPTPESVAV